MSRCKDEWLAEIQDMMEMDREPDQMDFDFRTEADKKLGIDVKKMVDIVAKDANIDLYDDEVPF